MAIKKLPSTGDRPRSTGVPESLAPGGAADSAGFPWQGRTFDHHDTAFADDDGSTPEAIDAAVRALRAASAAVQGRQSSDVAGAGLSALAAAHGDAILALSRSRLLVPLLAEAGDVGLTPEGKVVEKTQELSIVTVKGPDGRRVLPVFSSTETMRAWNPEARPIPVAGTQVALAAAQDGTDLIIVDAATPEREFGVRRPALQPLALGERWVPAWADTEVERAFAASIGGDARVAGVVLAPGDPDGRLLSPETDVVVFLARDLEPAELAEVVGALQQRWAADEVIAERVDSLRVRPARA